MRRGRLVTAARLLRMPEIDQRYKLRRGVLIERQFASARVGIAAGHIIGALHDYSENERLGQFGLGAFIAGVRRGPEPVAVVTV